MQSAKKGSSMTRKLVVITGASAGIGAAFARAYAARGWDVALTARREDRLIALRDELMQRYGVTAHAIAADLAEANGPKAIIAGLDARGLKADGLVNNAGYGLNGDFTQTRWKEQAAFLQVLATAPTELAHAVLPGMLERRYGRIINVASLAGLVPGGPGLTLYGAVKAYMIKFSQSLNQECLGTGVHVSALCPGYTRSEFHVASGMEGSISRLPGFMWQKAEAVVEGAIAAVDRNQSIFVSGGVNKGLAVLSRLLPDPIGETLVRRQSRNFHKMD